MPREFQGRTQLRGFRTDQQKRVERNRVVRRALDEGKKTFLSCFLIGSDTEFVIAGTAEERGENFRLDFPREFIGYAAEGVGCAERTLVHVFDEPVGEATFKLRACSLADEMNEAFEGGCTVLIGLGLWGEKAHDHAPSRHQAVWILFEGHGEVPAGFELPPAVEVVEALEGVGLRGVVTGAHRSHQPFVENESRGRVQLRDGGGDAFLHAGNPGGLCGSRGFGLRYGFADLRNGFGLLYGFDLLGDGRVASKKK